MIFGVSGRPTIRNAWSAGTLLSGVRALDARVIKSELPDNLEELQKMSQALRKVQPGYGLGVHGLWAHRA